MMLTPDLVKKAQRHLTRRDAVLKRLIAEVGPCTLQPSPERFATLVRSIVAQQISTRAAVAISTRLLEATGRAGLTPAGILRLTDEQLRGAGLSAGKVLSLRDLATRVKNGSVPLDDMADLTDEEVIDCLVPVRGIGRWTAQMFLIFSLGRPDVLPVDDFGLKASVQRQYQLADLPNKTYLTTLAGPWQPYRSIATWYFWRSLGNVPQSK
jgi:DNA-3-methyladenine glycosylase II